MGIGAGNFGGRLTNIRRVSDHMWSFLIGILIGTTTGVFSGVVLVAVLARGWGFVRLSFFQ
jgi:hypothetical protein